MHIFSRHVYIWCSSLGIKHLGMSRHRILFERFFQDALC